MQHAMQPSYVEPVDIKSKSNVPFFYWVYKIQMQCIKMNAAASIPKEKNMLIIITHFHNVFNAHATLAINFGNKTK